MRQRGAWHWVRWGALVLTVMIMLVGASSQVAAPLLSSESASGTSLNTASELAEAVESDSDSNLACMNLRGGNNLVVFLKRDSSGGEPPSPADDPSLLGSRQREHRRLWGMSKRLVPTGPNPLHN